VNLAYRRLAVAALVLGLVGSARAERFVTNTPKMRVGTSTPSITTVFVDKGLIARGLPERLGIRSKWWTPIRSAHGQEAVRWLLAGRTAEGEIALAKLPSLLEPGRRYTVVVTDNAVAFSPVGRNLVSKLLSKHYILSDGEPEQVRYAGEMWRDGDRLVLDDSSGTFRPSVGELRRAVAFFRDHLGIRDVIARATIGEKLGPWTQSSMRSTQRRAER
jgi:hypothetical protein